MLLKNVSMILNRRSINFYCFIIFYFCSQTFFKFISLTLSSLVAYHNMKRATNVILNSCLKDFHQLKKIILHSMENVSKL